MKTLIRIAAAGASLAMIVVAGQRLHFTPASSKTHFVSTAQIQHASNAIETPGRTGRLTSVAQNPVRFADEWEKKFTGAADYDQFITEAMSSAMRGDGRASYYIARALIDCAPYVNRYRGDANPSAAFAADQMSRIKDPQWYRDVVSKRFQQCQHLIHDHPFGELPRRKGGYGFSFWYKQAVADGDPVAVMDQAASTLASLYSQSPSTQTDAQQHAAQVDIRRAVESGDPHAIFLAGMILANSRYSEQPLEGVAIALAACDMGYDCSAANPNNPFSLCSKTGACPADADFAYYMQKSLGTAEYAAAFTYKQEFENMLARSDVAGIDSATQLRARGTLP